MSTQYPFLPSSRSYLTLPSPPSLPSSILSPPLPTSLSMPAFQSHHVLECQPHQHRSFSPVDRANLSYPLRALPSAPQQQEEDGDSLLLHTASVLALSALEQKGHSWLAARKSSTSLSRSLPTSPTTSGGEYFPPTAIHSRACSHRSFAMSTPRAGRSRHHSRRSSTSKSAPNSYSAADFVMREPLLQHEPGFDLNDGRNNRAAAATAESEVQHLLMARVGGWLEWAVGWMDFRDDDDDDVHDDGNGDYDAGNNNRLSGIVSAAHDNEHRQIWQGVDHRDGIEAPSATLDEMNIREGMATKSKTKTTTAVSQSELDSGCRNGDETGSRDGAMLDVGIPLPPPTYPQQLSLLGAGAGAGTGAGNWNGVQDVWWGDAKWLFSVARRVAF